jgi:heparan-alpha-glucosaminide N-acetyltransferase
MSATPPDEGIGDALSRRPRLVSLDTFRGIVMLLMASDGLRLGEVARSFPESRTWQFLARQSDHVRWQGCTLWDLIMPAFLFMVGVALPYSVVSRRRRGQGTARLFAHAICRSILLVVLGILIMRFSEPRSGLNFINVLAQIGLGYWIVFLLTERSARTQALVFTAILAGYGFWFYAYPLPGPEYDYVSVGVPAGWHHPEGVAAHWDLNTNPAAAFDRWFLNLLPQSEPFRFREGGGTTLNFIPSIATMLLGVMVGNWFRSERPETRKITGILVAGMALMIAGIACDPAILPGVESMRWSICPIIKRLWTPSYVLYSGGWVMLIAGMLYWIIDIRGIRRWTFPFVVVGMNSIVIYLLAAVGAKWIREGLFALAGRSAFESTYGPIVESLAVLAICWLICLFLYRLRIFVRI